MVWPNKLLVVLNIGLVVGGLVRLIMGLVLGMVVHRIV